VERRARQSQHKHAGAEHEHIRPTDDTPSALASAPSVVSTSGCPALATVAASVDCMTISVVMAAQ